jgi:hypothetical protein
MAKKSQKPIVTLRDGFISAAIWRNENDNGTFFAVTFNRAYKDGDKLQNTSSFSGTDLLKVARLAEQSYDAIRNLAADKNADAQNQVPEPPDNIHF